MTRMRSATRTTTLRAVEGEDHKQKPLKWTHMPAFMAIVMSIPVDISVGLTFPMSAMRGTTTPGSSKVPSPNETRREEEENISGVHSPI